MKKDKETISQMKTKLNSLYGSMVFEAQRKTDMQSIKNGLALIAMECAKHNKCKDCKLYGEGLESNCILDHPPAVWNIDIIITKMFHVKHYGGEQC